MTELVTGGSGSGKSAYAEERICGMYRELCRTEEGESCSLYYIATMFPYGAETEKKIARHRAMREGKGFRTLEWYTDIKGRLKEKGPDMENACVLLECMSNLVANELYMDGGIGKRDIGGAVEQITEGIRALEESCRHLVIVTNEVFSEPCPDSREMEEYESILGQVSRRLAKSADEVTEVVCGIPHRIKICPDSHKILHPARARSDSHEISYPVKMYPDECGRTGGAVKKDGTEQRGKAKVGLVIGGAYQGKAEYAKELYSVGRWLDGEKCPLDAAGETEAYEDCRADKETQTAADCQGIGHFHVFVRRWLKAGRTKEELLDILLQREQDIVIVCDEIGCGLVPVDAFEREYRETVGRICAELAGHAVRVDRVICGIGQRIK